MLPVDPRLSGEIGGQAACPAIVVAAHVLRISLSATIDAGLPIAQPPMRLAKAVERLGIPWVLFEGGLERLARASPIGLGKALPAGLHARHR